jgi:hypothetical protein
VKNIWLYITLRILAFALPLAVLLVLGFNPYYSVAIATAIGLAVSILWLSRSREELSKTIYDRFNNPSSADTAEDDD